MVCLSELDFASSDDGFLDGALMDRAFCEGLAQQPLAEPPVATFSTAMSIHVTLAHNCV